MLIRINQTLPHTPTPDPQLTQLRQQIAVVERCGAAGAMKRALDVAVSLLLLIALAPLLMVISLAIKLTSPGPVFFYQDRVGKGGRIFRFYKFRTMVVGAEALKQALGGQNEKDGPIFKIRHDPRVTWIGRRLRRYSLDELPQLFNVLMNDMSLVGPRPPVPAEVLRYEPWQLRRLSVVPGLTCIWQTSGRSHLTFEQWMHMDLDYIDKWTLGLDVKLLLKTFKAVVTADGAY